ncbi:hypothetical protein ACFWCA_32660 [Streptomyces phaeochromogenes]|uniref:zinc finger domain-containing protein n=1 Tax=Streptomyces phaeochromogenes TaxID=1923 RepID=UPI0036A5AE19
MTEEETVVLARYVRALCPQQKFDEYTADAWHDVLGDYNPDDAREAAARVARRQPFVAPSEIVAEIGKIRGERTHAFVYEPPSGDRDPNYFASYRAQLAATGDGRRPPVIAKALPARPVAELVEALADGLALPSTGDPALDEELAAVRRPGPLGIACPQCGAAIGRPCKAPARGGRTPRERPPHSARKTAAAGGTVTDPATARTTEAERRATYLRQLEQMQEPTT